MKSNSQMIDHAGPRIDHFAKRRIDRFEETDQNAMAGVLDPEDWARLASLVFQAFCYRYPRKCQCQYLQMKDHGEGHTYFERKNLVGAETAQWSWMKDHEEGHRKNLAGVETAQ